MGLLVACLCALSSIQLIEGAVTPTETTYVQTGSPVAEVACPGLGPDSPVSLVFWYKGPLLDPAVDLLVARSGGKSVGDEYAVSPRYGLTPGYALTIAGVNASDSDTYWCRIILRENSDEKKASMELVVVTPRRPSVSACSGLSGHAGCEVGASRQLTLDCEVRDALPPPSLSWELVDCEKSGGEPARWFVSEQETSAREDGNGVGYDVSRSAFLGALELDEDTRCSLACLATGVAIFNGSARQTVTVNGLDEVEESAVTYCDNRAGLTAGVVILFLLTVILLIILLSMVLKDHRWNRWSKRFRHNRGGLDEEETKDQKIIEQGSDEQSTLLLKSNTDEGDPSRNIKGDKTVWRHRRELLLNLPGGVVGIVPSTEGGLAVASPKSIQRLTATFASLPHGRVDGEEEEGEVKKILGVAAHPNSGSNPLVSLSDDGLALYDPGQRRKVRSIGVKREAYCLDLISVDDEGLVFAAARNTKSLYTVLPTRDAAVQTHDLASLTVAGIAAYGSRHVFVTNGTDKILKYRCQPALKRQSKIKVDARNSTVVRDIQVHAGLLYALLGTTVECKVQQYDAESCEALQVMHGGSLLHTLGMCFFSFNRVALYSAQQVDIFEAAQIDAEEE